MEVMEYIYSYDKNGETIDVFQIMGTDTYYHENAKTGKIIKITGGALPL